eukprot:COSAG04_NODE_375_length_15605_cov_23.679414_1_plen_110_part_00
MYEMAGVNISPTIGDHSTANGTAETKHRTVWRQLQGVGIDQHKWLDRLDDGHVNAGGDLERARVRRRRGADRAAGKRQPQHLEEGAARFWQRVCVGARAGQALRILRWP